jgi:hypothetical protein
MLNFSSQSENATFCPDFLFFPEDLATRRRGFPDCGPHTERAHIHVTWTLAFNFISHSDKICLHLWPSGPITGSTTYYIVLCSTVKVSFQRTLTRHDATTPLHMHASTVSGGRPCCPTIARIIAFLIDTSTRSTDTWVHRLAASVCSTSIETFLVVGAVLPRLVLKAAVTPDTPPASGVREVQFLNDDTILSAHYHGQITVHRLAVGNDPHGKARKILDLPALEQKRTHLKLFPLSDGTSFAMGLPNGDFRIYSGEGAKWSSPSSTLSASSSWNPAIAPTPIDPLYAPFYTTINHVNGVRRRYHRQTYFSLWESQNRHRSFPRWSEISDSGDQEIHYTCLNTYKWIDNTNSLPGRGFRDIHDTGWAFRETGSTLHAAFVDPERDCFSILDHRIPGPVLCFSKQQDL